ncbi:enoyl-CoA hydratase/isomerase family protein [Pseudonocardia oroxyli]|uniref:Enoyl-CoA hydratase/carnithine racemase n=1 Tax=Pseudonocardia oroxyli TaxID=366584 RepID=A0A1G7X1Z0_PSEOR|nr:hypothetical protein [Pseudonocardia oroxyli]SDG78195.1 hypothetical protein SAMN05216377_11559 [Pseudonocardia oroxyli]
MSDSIVTLTRVSPQIARITYANPPVNLIVGDTVRRLTDVVTALVADPDLQVVVFDSGTPDFFLNHFDLAHLADFPGASETTGRSAWTDLVLQLTAASADYDATTAERWGWVTRALPDAELDAHVDGVVHRLAAFDRTTLAAAKQMVNRASLPPEDDLVQAYREFEHSVTLPGFRERAAATPTSPPDQALRLELDLGAVLGAAALRRARQG